MGRRQRTILAIVWSAAVVAAAPPRPAQAQSQSQPPLGGAAAPSSGNPATAALPTTGPTSGAVIVRADVAGDMGALRAALLLPDARPADREQAAARLVSRDRPEADDILRAALTGDMGDARLAAVRALIDDPTPSEAFVAPLAEAIRSGAEQRAVGLVDAAAQALASYRGNSAALDALVRFAADETQPSDARVRCVRALGRVVEPESARTLVVVLRDRGPLRAAAADALTELTGIQQFGADAERWATWLQNNAGAMVTDRDGWRARMLDARVARLERVRRRHDALAAALDERLFQQYLGAAREGRGPAQLLSFLNSEQPDERAVGARLVTRAFRTDPITDAVRERLVAMVGDSDAGVRFDVASTLTNLNHRPALAAELTQLAQERDDRVKVALADAVGRVEDPAAAPQLAALLVDETSARVITAAANALAKVGADLRRADPALARRVTDRLRQVVLNRGAAADARAAALEALGVLQAPGLLELAQTLLIVQPDPSATVRQAALKVLGSFGPTNDGAATERAEIIARALRAEAREPEVRKAALDALARVGNLPEHGELLLRYADRQDEPDESVRVKAWESFQALLPRATPAQINVERKALRADPVRGAVVLEEMCRQLEQSQRPQDREDLANFRIELGGVYGSQKPPQPTRAIPHFRAALDFYFRNGAGENVTEPIVQSLMSAHLASRDYAGAADFAEEMIRRDARHQDTVGPLIRNEADGLRRKQDTAAALSLIAEALKLDPPLDDRFQRDLRLIRQEIGGQ